jgi:hypothetical protein
VPDSPYARKNIGYLAAMREAAERIIETEDDNYPLPTFWQEREREVPVVKTAGLAVAAL